jgi:hypothetical protein
MIKMIKMGEKVDSGLLKKKSCGDSTDQFSSRTSMFNQVARIIIFDYSSQARFTLVSPRTPHCRKEVVWLNGLTFIFLTG